MDYVRSYANGSTFQEISKSTFRELEFTIPENKSYQKFQDLVISKFTKMKMNSIQIRTLTALRDLLLPKLISGEVRVKV
jgi:type I restriction enzyme S subunit